MRTCDMSKRGEQEDSRKERERTDQYDLSNANDLVSFSVIRPEVTLVAYGMISCLYQFYTPTERERMGKEKGRKTHVGRIEVSVVPFHSHESLRSSCEFCVAE
jgi:hypothetical protein